MGLNRRYLLVFPDLEVFLHELVGHRQVLHHAFDFGYELITALSLEPHDHHLLRVIARRLLQEETPAEASLVELLEDVLGLYYFEQDEDIVDDLDEVIVTDADLATALLEMEIEVLGQELSHDVRLNIQEVREPFSNTLISEDLLHFLAR